MSIYNDIEKILVSKEQIQLRVKAIANDIMRDFKGETILLICILKGSCFFFADLARALDNFVEIEFMSVSSYGSETRPSGEVRILQDLSCPIEGKNVIIVEDIIDTGYTLSYLTRILRERRPKSLKVCSLLDKPARREVDFQGDYVGFKIPNEYAVGYGLDYDQKYRNIPDVGVLKPELYAHKN